MRAASSMMHGPGCTEHDSCLRCLAIMHDAVHYA
jgi:hypothetical protein